MRMHVRRFSRLKNAFSKNLEHHVAAVSLHMMFYHFVQISADAQDRARDGGWRQRTSLGDLGHRQVD